MMDLEAVIIHIAKDQHHLTYYGRFHHKVRCRSNRRRLCTARYYSSSRASITTVIAGRGYYTAAGNIYCIDIRTGEQLWTAPGSFQAGAVDGGVPILLNVGTRIIKYNGLTGAVTRNMTGITGIASAGDIQFEIKPTYYCAYIQTLVGPAPPTIVPATFDGYYLVKLWLNGTTTNLSDRIAWNVSMAPLNTRFSGGSMQMMETSFTSTCSRL